MVIGNSMRGTADDRCQKMYTSEWVFDSPTRSLSMHRTMCERTMHNQTTVNNGFEKLLSNNHPQRAYNKIIIFCCAFTAIEAVDRSVSITYARLLRKAIKV